MIVDDQKGVVGFIARTLAIARSSRRISLEFSCLAGAR